MALILNSEYGNINAARKYPFADSATLKDGDGLGLPLNFIVDACLYPLTQGLLYVSGIDTAMQTLTLSDTVTGVKVAEVVYAGGGAVSVFEYEGYGRQLGVIVFGDVSGVAIGRSLRVFEPGATVFAPAACVPVQQAGVQGLLLPDGSLMTGDIVIRGEGGVRVRTFTEGPVQVLVFDVVGVPAPDLTACAPDAAPAICTLAVIQEQGSKIVAWKYADNAIGLSLANTSLDQLCARLKAPTLPPDPDDVTDPCAAHVEPVPETPAPVSEFDVALCGGAKTLAIVAPSSADYLNPILVQPLPPTVSVQRAQSAQGSVTKAERALTNFMYPPAAAGGIKIKVSGLGPSQA